MRVLASLVKYFVPNSVGPQQSSKLLCKATTNQILTRRHSYQKATSATIIEIHNGVGGSEAMLFANEMLGIYVAYFQSLKWVYKIDEVDQAELGGIRYAKLLIDSPGSFEGMIQEAGVHRVQRVPKTERHGRMHTSTVSISVTPKSILEVKLNERDLEFSAKRASGPGGQHVNKTESAVRLLHRPTGIAVESQESRHQIENRKNAMKKLMDRIQQLELEKMTNQALKLKKSQLGHADRNEKIRTYNFPQDRITDHRIGKTYHNLRGLISGDVSVLHKMIEDFHGSE